MRVRFWSFNALSGELAGELHFSTATMSEALSPSTKGRFDGRLSLNLSTRNMASPDYPAIRRRLSWTQPWFRSIVATGVQQDRDGNDINSTRRVLGEWIVTARTGLDTGSPEVPITGIPWSSYPDYLLLQATRTLTVNAGGHLHWCLVNAYDGAAVTVPGFSTSWSYAMDRQIYSGQLGDVIREVCEADQGIEWWVESVPVWDGPDLAGVDRIVRVAAPEIRRASSILLEAGEPLTRQGNARFVGGGEDARDYAAQVVGIGSGEGSKQLIASASNSSLQQRGYLNATKAVSYREAQTQAALDSLTVGELARSQGSLGGQVSLPREPWEVVIEADRIAELPKLGHVVQLRHRQSWAWPGPGDPSTGAMAIDQEARIGDISYQVTAGHCDEIRVRAI